MEEHLAPAGDLTLQPGLQGVPLAENEAVHGLLPGLRARQRRPARGFGYGPGRGPASGVGMVPGPIVAYLPAGAPFCAVPSCLRLVGHAKCLPSPYAPGIPRFAGPSLKKRRLEEACSRVATRDANGYQAISSDRGFLSHKRIRHHAGSMCRGAPKPPERGYRTREQCRTRTRYTGPVKEGGDPSNRLGSIILRRTRLGVRALRHLVPEDTDFRPPFWLNNMSGKGNRDPHATTSRGVRDGDAHGGRKGIEGTICCPNKRGSARGLG